MFALVLLLILVAKGSAEKWTSMFRQVANLVYLFITNILLGSPIHNNDFQGGPK